MPVPDAAIRAASVWAELNERYPGRYKKSDVYTAAKVSRQALDRGLAAIQEGGRVAMTALRSDGEQEGFDLLTPWLSADGRELPPWTEQACEMLARGVAIRAIARTLGQPYTSVRWVLMGGTGTPSPSVAAWLLAYKAEMEQQVTGILQTGAPAAASLHVVTVEASLELVTAAQVEWQMAKAALEEAIGGGAPDDEVQRLQEFAERARAHLASTLQTVGKTGTSAAEAVLERSGLGAAKRVEVSGGLDIRALAMQSISDEELEEQAKREEARMLPMTEEAE